MQIIKYLVVIMCLLSVQPSLAEAPALQTNIAELQLKANHDGDDGSNWPLYSRNYKAWRYSPLTQINKENVKDLKVAWTLATGLHDAFEASLIVIDGTMFFTTPWNHVYAVNAATGEVYWHHSEQLKPSIPLCCGAVNRGCAVTQDKVVFATLDARLIALNATTGKKLWDTTLADIKDGYSATIAPQIIGDKVLVGISGGDFGVRGFLDAYDVNNGNQLWRFWTVPGPGEPGHETWTGDSWKTGGGPAWMTPTYDNETKTLFWGIGNPGPDLEGAGREGANLYTECTIAQDLESGKLKWHYQVIPHDVWDLDNVVEPVLDDVMIDGRLRKVVMTASKNGFFYMLDRTNGEFIYAIPFAHKITWGTVSADGTANIDKSKFPVRDKWTIVYPGAAGGKEWCPVAYDPVRKRMFIPAIENGHRHKIIQQEFKPGLLFWGGVSAPVPNEAYGHIVAIDVEKKQVAWDVKTTFPVVCGITCTASGLVITGLPDQKMLILDADSGDELWSFKAVSGWHSAPVVYAVDGKQYIGFANGWGGWVAGFDLMGTPELENLPKDNIMYSFTLFEPKKESSNR